MISLRLFGCFQRKSYSTLPLHYNHNQDCHCRPIKVDPLAMQYLTQENQEQLKLYLEIVNSNCVKKKEKLLILSTEDRKILKSLMIEIRLIEYNVI